MITLNISDAKLAAWLFPPRSPCPANGDNEMIVIGGDYVWAWPIDPEAWKR